MSCLINACDLPVRCKGMCTRHDKARWIKKNRLEKPEYYVWLNMKARCYNKNLPTYKHYGARGITVCERWLSYANFIADMGKRPSGMTLERKDNERNYEPDNCIWADWATQSANKNRPLAQSGERYIHKKNNQSGYDVRVVRDKKTVYRSSHLLLDDAITSRDAFFQDNSQYVINYPVRKIEV